MILNVLFVKKKLVPFENKDYITWFEEIADPNAEIASYKDRPTMICSNDECIFHRKDNVGFWDVFGSWYWEKWVPEEFRKRIKVVSKGDLSALWSSDRVIKNEKQKRIPILNLYFLKFYIEWTTKCEPRYGKKIGIKKIKLIILKRKEGSYFQYISGVSQLIYLFKKFYRAKSRFLIEEEYNPNYWYIEHLKDSFTLKFYNKELWYHKLFFWYINAFEKKIRTSFQALESLID